MPKMKTKEDARLRRKKRLRKKVAGNPDMPRLCVFRSLNHIYVQAIDDRSGKTLLSASSLEICKQKGIDAVRFDRSGYLYHGRVKALAEAARAAGLKF